MKFCTKLVILPINRKYKRIFKGKNFRYSQKSTKFATQMRVEYT